MKSPYRGRFAPSPTGNLHLGGASTALCAWLSARKAGGTLLMRIEDIDTPRVRPESEDGILEDLTWLGLDWDEEPGGLCRQSERTEHYENALSLLNARNLTYPCDCSRKELAQLASAPAPGSDGPTYPGFCRDAQRDRVFRRSPCTRVLVPDNTSIAFRDAVFGEHRVDLARETGDFVLRRGDGVFAYQLAVVVDDIAQGITEVVRGADLLSSTARQIFLMECLGAKPPTYAHAPIVVGPDGEKLAKRAFGIAVRDHRRAGVDPKRLVASLAYAIGLAEGGEELLSPRDLVDRFSWRRVRREPISVDGILDRVRVGVFESEQRKEELHESTGHGFGEASKC